MRDHARRKSHMSSTTKSVFETHRPELQARLNVVSKDRKERDGDDTTPYPQATPNGASVPSARPRAINLRDISELESNLVNLSQKSSLISILPVRGINQPLAESIGYLRKIQGMASTDLKPNISVVAHAPIVHESSRKIKIGRKVGAILPAIKSKNSLARQFGASSSLNPRSGAAGPHVSHLGDPRYTTYVEHEMPLTRKQRQQIALQQKIRSLQRSPSPEEEEAKVQELE